MPATEAGPAPVARDTGSSPHDPLCAFCGQLVPAMAAIIYHGVAYHPTCVAPTTGRDDHA